MQDEKTRGPFQVHPTHLYSTRNPWSRLFPELYFLVNVFSVRLGIKIKVLRHKNPAVVRFELIDSDRERG